MKLKDILIPLLVVIVMVVLTFIVLSMMGNNLDASGYVDCGDCNPQISGFFPWSMIGLVGFAVFIILLILICFILPKEDELNAQLNKSESGGKTNGITK